MTMSTPDNGAINDDVLYAIGEGPAASTVMVGNEQLADAPGVKGPDPAQWDDVEARNEPEAVETPEGYYKGPSRAEWGDVARAERGADPSDNPAPSLEVAEPIEVATDDAAAPA